jgi:hypothetical protein
VKLGVSTKKEDRKHRPENSFAEKTMFALLALTKLMQPADGQVGILRDWIMLQT